jgi:predicted nucleic acid-binding protein
MDLSPKMIAIDTNILVYAHRRGTSQHKAAKRAIEKAITYRFGWGIALPSISEFWSVVTHPSSVGGPSTPFNAAAFLRSLLRTGGGQLWLPKEGFPDRFLELVANLEVHGPRIFDVQIALISFENGATELWTHDQNFVSVPGLKIRDPL